MMLQPDKLKKLNELIYKFVTKETLKEFKTKKYSKKRI